VAGKRFLSGLSDEDYFKRVKAEADKVCSADDDPIHIFVAWGLFSGHNAARLGSYD
jgi:hypothetical protein